MKVAQSGYRFFLGSLAGGIETIRINFFLFFFPDILLLWNVNTLFFGVDFLKPKYTLTPLVQSTTKIKRSSSNISDEYISISLTIIIDYYVLVSVAREGCFFT